MRSEYPSRLAIKFDKRASRLFEKWCHKELRYSFSKGIRYVLMKQLVIFFRDHDYGNTVSVTRYGYKNYLKKMENQKPSIRSYRVVYIPTVVMNFIKERARINSISMNTYVMRVLIKEMANS